MAERRRNNKNNHTPGSPHDLVEWARSQYQLLDARRTRAEIGSAVQDEASSKSPHGLVEWAKSQYELLDRQAATDGQELTLQTRKTHETGSTGARPVSTGRELVPQPSRQLTVRQSVTLGHDAKTGEAVTLGEVERCGGFYVLGQARSGKSNLMISMALQDIEQGWGLLFIDPHVDAIRDILARLPPHRQSDVILLDPWEDQYAFGINVLDR
jgi:hypothetical protein